MGTKEESLQQDFGRAGRGGGNEGDQWGSKWTARSNMQMFPVKQKQLRCMFLIRLRGGPRAQTDHVGCAAAPQAEAWVGRFLSLTLVQPCASHAPALIEGKVERDIRPPGPHGGRHRETSGPLAQGGDAETSSTLAHTGKTQRDILPVFQAVSRYKGSFVQRCHGPPTGLYRSSKGSPMGTREPGVGMCWVVKRFGRQLGEMQEGLVRGSQRPGNDPECLLKQRFTLL